MLSRWLKWTGLALLAGLAVAWIMIQHRVIGELRRDNNLMPEEKQRLAGLPIENEVLSNRLAQASALQPAAEAPSSELLRLRGRVGVLRRELREAQSLARSQTSSITSSSPEGNQDSTQGLRVQHTAETIRLEAILGKIRNPDTDEQARTSLLSREDEPLRSLLAQLKSAEVKVAALQKQRGGGDPELQNATAEVADFNRRI
jgi:hypothetical protein